MPSSLPRPSEAGLLHTAALGLLEAGQPELAREAALLALRVDPAHGPAHGALATALESLGESGAALAHWRHAARLMPDQPQPQLNLALALLADGAWAEGWAQYEIRTSMPGWSSMAAQGSIEAVRARIPGPGTDLAGKRVLVVSEQGMGDAIWAARFLAKLAARGARVTLATSAALRPVLARIAGTAEVISPPSGERGARINLRAVGQDYDHVLPMMSLPWLLGIARPEEAASGAYLAVDFAETAGWRARYRAAFPAARCVAGIVWQVNPEGPRPQQRSMPAAALAPLAGIPGLALVNLQGGGPAIAQSIAPVLPGLFDAIDRQAGPPPLDRFAAAVAATDIVITVDTMAAHLAGAMGHPALVMLAAAPHAGFFWGQQGARSPAYPGHRLYRQAKPGDWAPVIATLCEAVIQPL